MSRKTQRTPRLTRREKMLQERLAAKEAITASDTPPEASKGVRIEAKNYNQKQALQLLNSGTQVVFLMGSAGTGKSLLACSRAAYLLKNKKIDKVFLARPAVGVGKTIGLLPG